MSYKRFDAEDVIVSADSVTSTVWSNNVVTLTEFYTSSVQVSSNSGDYFYDIYQTGSSEDNAEVQFSIGFGHKKGSGSQYFDDNVVGKTPTSAVYGQYRSLVLGDEDTDFTFGTITSSYFYAINFNRARYKEKLLPGTLSLTLTSGSETIVLTDNSQAVSTVSYVDSGRVYELVSGSLGVVNTSKNSNGYTGTSGSYGKFLPDVGIILLNGLALAVTSSDGGLGMASTLTADTAGNNPAKLYNAIKTGASFRVNSEETVSSNYVFVRARNSEFNYSNNPSNITGSGELRHSIMIDRPQAYATTVGLYNDNNDLLAVAKLSRPLVKDFTKEILCKIKIDY